MREGAWDGRKGECEGRRARCGWREGRQGQGRQPSLAIFLSPAFSHLWRLLERLFERVEPVAEGAPLRLVHRHRPRPLSRHLAADQLGVRLSQDLRGSCQRCRERGARLGLDPPPQLRGLAGAAWGRAEQRAGGGGRRCRGLGGRIGEELGQATDLKGEGGRGRGGGRGEEW